MARIATSHPASGPPNAKTRTSSLDQSGRLKESVGANGISDLEVQMDNTPSTSPTTEQPRSMRVALSAIASRDSFDSSTSEEDYDQLKHDPETVMAGSHGGGFGGSGGLRKQKFKEEVVFEALNPRTEQRPKPQRLRSIPITLKESDQKGRYILTADDFELREILRIGEEKVGST